MVEAYFTLKIWASVLFATMIAVTLIVCIIKKVVEAIALACKKKRKKNG